MQDKKKLYVPANIPLKKQIIKGLYVKEFTVLCVTTAILIVIDCIVIIGFKFDIFLPMLCSIIALAVVFSVVQKPGNSISVAEFIGILINYAKEQQTFDYIYKMEEVKRLYEKTQ